jgi:hypothetical protein
MQMESVPSSSNADSSSIIEMLKKLVGNQILWFCFVHVVYTEICYI